MARITVEDCLANVDNRFQLVMIASKRARQLQIEGKDPLLPVDNDKPTVIALREIAEGLVSSAILIEKPSIDFEEEFGNATAEASADTGAGKTAAAEPEATASEASAESEAASGASEADGDVPEEPGDEEAKPAAEE